MFSAYTGWTDDEIRLKLLKNDKEVIKMDLEQMIEDLDNNTISYFSDIVLSWNHNVITKERAWNLNHF